MGFCQGHWGEVMRLLFAFFALRVHRHGRHLANTTFSLIDMKHHSFKFVVPLLVVIRDVTRTVFVGHVAGWRGYNLMFANPGAFDVGYGRRSSFCWHRP